MKCPNDGSELELNKKEKKFECPNCWYYEVKETFQELLTRIGANDRNIDSIFIRDKEQAYNPLREP